VAVVGADVACEIDAISPVQSLLKRWQRDSDFDSIY